MQHSVLEEKKKTNNLLNELQREWLDRLGRSSRIQSSCLDANTDEKNPETC